MIYEHALHFKMQADTFFLDKIKKQTDNNIRTCNTSSYIMARNYNVFADNIQYVSS
jgi:hypothetical protein